MSNKQIYNQNNRIPFNKNEIQEKFIETELIHYLVVIFILKKKCREKNKSNMNGDKSK